jgi:hypothetical protein
MVTVETTESKGDGRGWLGTWKRVKEEAYGKPLESER